MARLSGSIKKFFQDKGFGFIQPDDGTADVFAHARTLIGDKLSIFDGMRVSYEAASDPMTGKMAARSWGPEGGQAPPAAGMAGMGGMPAMGGTPAMGGMGGFGGSSLTGSMGAGMGHLKRFYADKGYGFIARNDGTGDLFAPARTFSGTEAEIYEGMQVVYEAGMDDRNGKPRASSWGPASGGAGAMGAAGAMAGMMGMGAMGGMGMDRFSPYGAAAPAAAAFGVAAPLPAGWETAQDPASGKAYYFNRSTGQTAWEPPAAAPAMPQAMPAAGGLPAGWEAAQDPGSGKTYYFNRSTGATQWDIPTM